MEWYTRTTQNRVEQSMRVRVSPPAEAWNGGNKPVTDSRKNDRKTTAGPACFLLAKRLDKIPQIRYYIGSIAAKPQYLDKIRPSQFATGQRRPP